MSRKGIHRDLPRAGDQEWKVTRGGLEGTFGFDEKLLKLDRLLYNIINVLNATYFVHFQVDKMVNFMCILSYKKVHMHMHIYVYILNYCPQ